jgi:inosine-uridine nucleoside N-ribohydrolase
MSLSKVVVVALLVATLTACEDDAPPARTSAEPPATVPVVLDYSTTPSDIGALLYLASHPGVDLLAVTLPGTGEADCAPGTRNTRQLLTIAGRPDVPVGCGRDEPLSGHRDWPDEWRRAANALPRIPVQRVEQRPVVDAEAMLPEVLERADRKVTVVAVGPLTNIAVTLTAHPELVSKIERVVVMGGAVDVRGNVPDAPSAEWNLYVDPEAARTVLGSGVPVLLVPLDATNDVPFGRVDLLRLGLLETPAGVAEYQRMSAQTFFEGAFMWDELAAVATMRPETVTVERRRLVVDADGATLTGADGSPVDVAVAADPSAFDHEFRRVLNGGSLPPTPALTSEEVAYLKTLSAGLRRAQARAEASFTALDGGDAHAQAAGFISGTVDAVAGLEADLRGRETPAGLTDVMTRLWTTADAIRSAEADLLQAVAGVDGADVWAILGTVFEQVQPDATIEDLFAITQELEDYSLLRGGPDLGLTP